MFKVISCLVVGSCTVHLFKKHIGTFIRCQGDSMNPAFQHGDILWARAWNPVDGELSPGDCVCLINPRNANEYVLKRVSTVHPLGRPSSPLSGRIEILGDNAGVSIDSRDYGPIPMGLVRYRISKKLLF